MSSFDLQKFISAVVQEHSLATGLKQLSHPSQIAEFARSKGFEVSLSEWIRAAWLDQLQLSDQDLERIWSTSPDHWSWAFQQIAPWRALLMEGATAAVPSAESAPVNLTEADKDQLLTRFIAVAQQDERLKQQIKDAKNDDFAVGNTYFNTYNLDERVYLSDKSAYVNNIYLGKVNVAQRHDKWLGTTIGEEKFE